MVVMEVKVVRLIMSPAGVKDAQLAENDDLFRLIAEDQNDQLTITMTRNVLKMVFAKRMESVSFELEMISSKPLRIITSQQRKFACPTKEGYISVRDLEGFLHKRS